MTITLPDDAFGELLHRFRKRAHLTQQQLAETIGRHRHAISRWEQGEVLPASKALVLELARALHLDEQEARQLLDASLTAPAPFWHVPFPRNPFFTGRQTLLQQLHSFLCKEQDRISSRSCALSGLAGIGKTQTAIEYAYQHALDYAGVFWLHAETEERILGSITALARTVKLPADSMQKQEDVVTLVLDWLKTHQGWLLIFDNVEQIALVKRFVPASPSGSILFTTRLPTLGILAPGCEMSPLSLEESTQLLLIRAGAQPRESLSAPLSQEEVRAARMIALALDGLPLALDQAGAYIEESHCRFSSFLSLFQHDALPLLQEHPASAAYPRSVETTFTLAFEALQQRNPGAASLLAVCCFLAPDEIPEALLLKGASHFDEELQAVLSHPLRLNAAFRDLLAYALLRRNLQTQTLSMHRLVQIVLKEQMPEATRRNWTERLIGMLDQLFLIEQGRVDVECWSWCEQVLPHAHQLFQLAEHWQLCSPALGSLLNKAATYLFQRARYEQAEALYLRALSVLSRVLGTDHHALAAALTGVADTHHQQGKYQEVEAFYQRALSVIEATLGSEHLQLAFPLQGLAFFYQEMLRYSEAEALYQRALHVCTQALGPEHPDVATAQHQLASFYWLQGDYGQAEQLFLQALHCRECSLPPHHPERATSLNDLAVLYCSQGRDQEAEALFVRSLALGEHALGPDHPDVAATLNNLARLYCRQARYALAEPLYQRAVENREQIYGPEHPYTAFFLHNLASLYCDQGRYQEAEDLAARVLSIYEQHLQADHHACALPLQTLARLAYQQNRYVEAQDLASRALALWEHHLPADHPGLGSVLHVKATICCAQGKEREAERLYQRALRVYRRSLGPHHLDLALLLDDLATLRLRQGKWEEAKSLLQEALCIWAHHQTLSHPAHAQCLDHYVQWLVNAHQEQDATEQVLRAQQIRMRRETRAGATMW